MATTEPAPATVSASDPMRPEPFVVRHVTRETGDTFTLTLAPVEGPSSAPSPPGSSTCSTSSAWARSRSRSAATRRGPRSSSTPSAPWGTPPAPCRGWRRATGWACGAPSARRGPSTRPTATTSSWSGRDRSRPPPARDLPRAPPSGALRPGGPPLRRAHAAGHALPEGAARVAQPLRPGGGRDRGPRRPWSGRVRWAWSPS